MTVNPGSRTNPRPAFLLIALPPPYLYARACQERPAAQDRTKKGDPPGQTGDCARPGRDGFSPLGKELSPQIGTLPQEVASSRAVPRDSESIYNHARAPISHGKAVNSRVSVPTASTGGVALITGGARGIGRAIALDLARAGWTVALCYRTSEAAAIEARIAIEALGARALALRADVSDPDMAEGLVRRVEEAFGRIDALINCAGPYHRVELLQETPAGWREMIDNNLHPLFYLSRAVAPGMISRKWGRIVAFGMATADQLTAQPNVTAHYIAKAGVLVLVRSLARVLAPHGITVNAISPGFVDSGSAPPGELEAMRPRIPAGYVGSVEDAVAACRFLLSEDARYVNGSNIHLSGGWGI